MLNSLPKSIIRDVSVTQIKLHFESSCSIDENLLNAADILDNEQIQIWNNKTSESFFTCAVKGERGSGVICLNGPSAGRTHVGDFITITSFVQINEKQPPSRNPRLVFVNKRNREIGSQGAIANEIAS